MHLLICLFLELLLQRAANPSLQEVVCGAPPGRRVLTLSPCTLDEFTCTSGICIPFDRRCDLKFDCEDKTDESFCDIINYPADYKSTLPPRPGGSRGTSLAC